jgi:hypothetical protein
MATELAPLAAAVRTNCHISDARHARELSLCTYLLEMRELYRWEHGVAFGVPLAHADVRTWIGRREALWSQLEDAEEIGLPLPTRTIDAYDVASANAHLEPYGMVYGAGVGRFGKPQFFLAELEREAWREGARILVAGREVARDLSAAPAASRDGTIYVRLESLRRLLWERIEARRSDGALDKALELQGFDGESDATLSAMVTAETEALILHELGECRAAALLGPGWEAMLGGLQSKRTELFVRAVRDHLADCLVTLPRLLDRGAVASVHFWFSNLTGMRRALFPAVASAYARWDGSANHEALRAVAHEGAVHWLRVGEAIVAAHLRGEQAIDAIASDPGTTR